MCRAIGVLMWLIEVAPPPPSRSRSRSLSHSHSHCNLTIGGGNRFKGMDDGLEFAHDLALCIAGTVCKALDVVHHAFVGIGHGNSSERPTHVLVVGAPYTADLHGVFIIQSRLFGRDW